MHEKTSRCTDGLLAAKADWWTELPDAVKLGKKGEWTGKNHR